MDLEDLFKQRVIFLVEQIASQMKGKHTENLKSMATSIRKTMLMGANRKGYSDDLSSDESEFEAKC
jgi:hypothetical protein